MKFLVEEREGREVRLYIPNGTFGRSELISEGMRVGKRRDKHASSWPLSTTTSECMHLPLSLRLSCPRKGGENANKATSKRPKLRGKNKNVGRRTKPHSGLPGRRTKRLGARRTLGSRLRSSYSILVRLLFVRPHPRPAASASFLLRLIRFPIPRIFDSAMPLDQIHCYQSLSSRFSSLKRLFPLFFFIFILSREYSPMIFNEYEQIRFLVIYIYIF